IHEYFVRVSSKWKLLDFLNECDAEQFDQKIGLYLRSLEKIANKEKGERQQKATILLEKYRKASLESLRIWWCGKDLEGFCHSSLEGFGGVAKIYKKVVWCSRLEADLTVAPQGTDNIEKMEKWVWINWTFNSPTFIVENSGNINGKNFNLSEKSAPKRKKDDNNEMDEHIKKNYPKKRTRIEEYFSVSDVVSQFSNDLSDALPSAMSKVTQKESEPYGNEKDNINDFDQEVFPVRDVVSQLSNDSSDVLPFAVPIVVCSGNSLYVENICVRSKIMEWRKKSKYIPEIHKQDLLRYNIIDTVESSSTNSRNLFKDIWDKMVVEIEAMLLPTAETTISSNVKDGQIKEVKTYVKTVVANVALKSERSNLRTGSNERWKRRILTIAKAFRDQFQNCKNAFNDDQTEYHYIITFIYQVFKPLFKDFQHIGLTWGEKSLQCSAILFNNSQQDGDRRNPGRKIDAIMKLLEVDLEFSVVEVSGSPKDPDHNHYIGDRNKIAKSLKIILNFIRMNHRGDFQRFRKIKFYGIQVF
ncbi:13435_t:CDS:10, partial [Cetraspora pellucida]